MAFCSEPQKQAEVRAQRKAGACLLGSRCVSLACLPGDECEGLRGRVCGVSCEPRLLCTHSFRKLTTHRRPSPLSSAELKAMLAIFNAS